MTDGELTLVYGLTDSLELVVKVHIHLHLIDQWIGSTKMKKRMNICTIDLNICITCNFATFRTETCIVIDKLTLLVDIPMAILTTNSI